MSSAVCNRSCCRPHSLSTQVSNSLALVIKLSIYPHGAVSARRRGRIYQTTSREDALFVGLS